MQDIELVFQFLKQCRPYFLATTDELGQPRVRPFGTAALWDGAIYIQTSREKAVSAQMRRSPRIELCGLHDGKWLRLAADAHPDPRPEAQRAVLDACPQLRGRYEVNDGRNEVFRLTNCSAALCALNRPPEQFRF